MSLLLLIVISPHEAETSRHTIFQTILGTSISFMPRVRLPSRGLNEDMLVNGHEIVGVTDPMVPFVDILEGVEKVQAILVVLEDRLFLLPSEVT